MTAAPAGRNWARTGLWWGLAVFAFFGLLVATGIARPYDLPLDRWILRNVPQPQGTPDWGGIGYLSIWGSQYATIPVTIVTVMGLLAMGAVRRARIVSAVGFVGGLLILGFQVAFRPFVAMHWADTGAQVVYPSGHAAGATMAWGFAAVFLLSSARSQAPPWVRPLLFTVWVAISVAVGIDRLLVRSHTLSDILGGWGLGVALVCIAVLVDRAAPGAGKDPGDSHPQGRSP
ncbi:MAG TPA: phosphatase PAP2 family protein [Candidatus Thermoplasmatota archaeon]|nr:phosphatase PAP2 family protein [Candidatus Thermoplasmatota archaeon]